MSAQNPKPVGVLGAFLGLIGFSALAGVLVTAMVTPAIAVGSVTANNTVAVFDDLPEYLELGELAQRNTLWALQGGQQVPFAQVYDQNRQEVTWDQVSVFAKDAAVAGEDERFFEHGGVDVAGIARAAVSNATSDTTQGASTITQQLAKNVQIANAMDLPEAERKQAVAEAQAGTLNRKLKEAKLAIGLEKKYSKQEILLAYLNIAGFGGNTYGIESASQLYFSTNAANLTVAQAAALLGIVQNPNNSRLDIPENWPRALERRNLILAKMLELGKIDQAQYDEAFATPLDATTVLINPPQNGCTSAAAAKTFCDFVKLNVKNLTSLGASEEERLERWKKGGLNVYTTIDLDQQAVAEADLAKRTPATESRFQAGSAISTIQVGTGRILIMAQNKGFDDTGLGDPATTTAVNFNTDKEYGGSSGFPTGSTYKLFTLIAWLQAGRGLREGVDANIKDYRRFDAKCAGGSLSFNPPYKPKNDSGKSQGTMNVLAATTGSVNAAFINMASKLDLCDIRDAAVSMGVHRANLTELEYYPSTILGTNEIAPLTMANAYAVVASGGMLCQPIAVDKIVTTEGEELAGQSQDCTRVLTPEVAAAAAFDLQGPMGGNGTGAAANPRDGTDYLGKTGTAEALHSFMVAASTKASTAVWVGNISGKQNLRRISVGGTLYSALRTGIMRPILASVNASPVYGRGDDFPAPPSGLLAGKSQAVPDVTGQTVEQATSLLESVGFSVQTGATVASEVPAGRVAATSPGVGAQLSKGSDVELQISDGTLSTVMPQVVGAQARDAVAAIAAAGLDPGKITYEYGQSQPGDACKVAASNPGGGATIAKSAAVALTVYGGVLTPGKEPNCG